MRTQIAGCKRDLKLCSIRHQEIIYFQTQDWQRANSGGFSTVIDKLGQDLSIMTCRSQTYTEGTACDNMQNLLTTKPPSTNLKLMQRLELLTFRVDIVLLPCTLLSTEFWPILKYISPFPFASKPVIQT